MTETTTASGTENDIDKLRRALFGRSVVRVTMPSNRTHDYHDIDGEVHLDDGTVLLLSGNEGCGGCSSGAYWLERLNTEPMNGILNVTLDVDDIEGRTTYRIFLVVEERGPVELAAFEGDDGNGYYGTGFWFSILAPDTPTKET